MLTSSYLWKPVLEIAILWFMLYHILIFFEGSKALQVLRGITILLVAFLLFQRLNLTILEWLLTKLFGISVIAILVIFHPEIRHGLARLGQRHLFSPALREKELDHILKEVTHAAENLSKNKIGAIVAIENSDSLVNYVATGVQLDARVSAELIETIFTPNSLLHDGGLIIREGRIAAAGCLFPLSQIQDLNRIFGTRHRAALGLSEDSDAIIIVISEERQDLSLVCQNKFYKDLSRQELMNKIRELSQTEKKK